MKQETAANLARISFVSVFAAFICGFCLKMAMSTKTIPNAEEVDVTTKLLIALIPVVIATVGLVCGIVAAASAIRCRHKSVLPMAVAGIIFNVGFFAFVGYTFVLIRNLAAEGKLPVQ